MIAEQLGFDGVTHNSLDAVSDRTTSSIIHAAAQTMMHLRGWPNIS
jgi:argininosuccinate lyase